VSFSPQGPFSFGQKLTSAVANAWDANIVNALDKSVAGDAIAGTITFTGSGNIQANAASAISSTIAGGIVSTVVGGIRPTITGGITDGGHVGGIQSTVAGGINDGGVTAGIRATVASGIQSAATGGISTNTPGGIAPTVAGGIGDGGVSGGIRLTVANGLQTGVAGAIQMTGGLLDYLSYSTNRINWLWQPIRPYAFPSGWSASGASSAISGPGTATTMIIPISALMNGTQNAAKLNTVTLFMSVPNTHASVSGMTFPGFSVSVYNIIPGFAVPGPSSLFSGGSVSFSAGSGSAWYASGNCQTLTMTCDQNNAIGFSNTGSAVYYIQLNDENGTNSASGNLYYGFVLGYDNIQSSAPY
jgi:hypothetical protein